MKALANLLLSMTLLVPGTAHTEVFRWLDDNGKINYGDRPPLNVNAERIEVNVASGNETKPPRDLRQVVQDLESKKAEQKLVFKEKRIPGDKTQSQEVAGTPSNY
ncbi:DUF4124 domain-containing protein [Litoribacillus peritrichatus]|uniref:DUF4124 domain-containing protein n=1 Tax=Litoribacillus peritrichatus TaxID=718191 RepID=A0ABP7MCC3_9GAMM